MDLARDQKDLQLIRASDPCTTVRFIAGLKKRIRPYLRRYGRKYICHSYDLAVVTICIVVEKEEEPDLTSELMTFLFKIAKNQWTKIKPQIDELCLNDGFLMGLSVEAIVYEYIEKNDRTLLVNMCLCRLDKRCQKILLAFVECLSPLQASRTIGYKSEKVYQVKKNECFKKLKSKIVRTRLYKELFDIKEDKR